MRRLFSKERRDGINESKAGWEIKGETGKKERFSKVIFRLITDKTRVKAHEAEVTKNTMNFNFPARVK